MMVGVEPRLVVEATIMDRFLKTCLVLVVLLLAVIAFRTVVSPHSVQAKTQHKYLAVRSYGSGEASGFGIQADLDKYAADAHLLISFFEIRKERRREKKTICNWPSVLSRPSVRLRNTADQ